MEIKITQFGVEVLARGEEENVRMLFPWAQVERVTQHGAAVSAVYTYWAAAPFAASDEALVQDQRPAVRVGLAALAGVLAEALPPAVLELDARAGAVGTEPELHLGRW